ncbi:MAG: HAD-IB family hydrolase [Propionibacterium sp.]|nr:HAD-IB family hydrolase [Propionibacterium sp.]
MPQTPPAGSPRVGAFFDIDKTLMRGASASVVATALLRRGLVNHRTIAFAVRQSLLYSLFGEKASRVSTVAQRAMRTVAGQSLEEMSDVIEQVWEPTIRPRLFARTLERIRWHLERGDEVWLASATPWLVSEMMARHLGATGGIGTRLGIRDGYLLAELDGPIVHAHHKAAAVRKLAEERGIDLGQSWAYSDSFHDVEMLESVGHPVAVNADVRLAAVARRRGWERLSTRTRKDRLRDRSLKAAAAALAAAGALAVVSGISHIMCGN